MNIKPYNKRLLIELIDSKKESSENSFDIPNQFKKKEERHHNEKYVTAKVIDMSDDIKYNGPNAFSGGVHHPTINSLMNKKIALETFAMEEVLINDEIFYFIPLQSVICVYGET